MPFLLLLLLIGAVVLLLHGSIRYYGFRNVEYDLRFSKSEVHEGETVTLIETICSRKAIPIPWLKVEMTTDATLEFAKMQSAVSGRTRFISSFYTLRPYRQIERRWQVHCTQRGVFDVSHVILVISDALGTLEQSKALPDVKATLTVLPAPAAFSAALQDPRQWMGEQVLRQSLMPDRLAMEGLRPYETGDSVRDICWSASARSETPVVYRFCDTTQPALTIVLNLATKEYDRDVVTDHAALEQVIRICTALIYQGTELRIPVRLCANTRINGTPLDTPAAVGGTHIHHLLQMLAAIPDTIDERFRNLLERVCHRETTALVWVVTACLDDDLLHMAALYPQLQIVTIRNLSASGTLPNIHTAAGMFAVPRKENTI